jgi:hypothetical protein
VGHSNAGGLENTFQLVTQFALVLEEPHADRDANLHAVPAARSCPEEFRRSSSYAFSLLWVSNECVVERDRVR